MERLTRMIPRASLQHLKNYKFHSGSSTFLDGLLNKIWWAPIAEMVPRCVSPNILTLCGAACVFSMYYVIIAFTPELDSSRAPDWIPLVVAAMTLLYMTFDGIDGKQARKLGVSSPLGQLLDHGVDAVVSVFYPYICFHIFPGGLTLPVFLLCCISPMHVLCTVWRESEFETFVYTNGTLGVTEANLIVIAVQLLYYYCRPFLSLKTTAVLGSNAVAAFVAHYFPRLSDLLCVGVYGISTLAWVEGLCGLVGLFFETGHRARYSWFVVASFAHVFLANLLAYTVPAASRIVGCLFASSLGAVVCVNNIICLLSKSPLRTMHKLLLPHYAILMQYFGVRLLARLGYAVAPLAPATLHSLLVGATVYGFACVLFLFYKTISEIMDYLGVPFLTVPHDKQHAKAS